MEDGGKEDVKGDVAKASEAAAQAQDSAEPVKPEASNGADAEESKESEHDPK